MRSPLRAVSPRVDQHREGKAFLPDVGRRQLLADAACLASAIARANTFASNDAERLVYPDRRWEWAFLGGSADWDTQGFVNSDRRAAFAYAAIGMSAAMVRKVIGQGSQYLWTMRDADGKYLDGSRTYRLRLPTKIPVAHFWSVVVYDPMSRSMLKTGPALSECQPIHGPGAQRRRLDRDQLRPACAERALDELDRNAGAAWVVRAPALMDRRGRSSTRCGSRAISSGWTESRTRSEAV